MLRDSSTTACGIVALNSNVCRSFGSSRDHTTHVLNEAHVEHAIGLVQHEVLDVTESHQALAHQIQEASGCCHQDVDATLEGCFLCALPDAAVNHGVAQTKVPAVRVSAFGNLGGELSRGREDQRSDRARLLRRESL